MSRLIIDFKNGYDGMKVIKDFPTDHNHLPVFNEKAGWLWRHWRASMLIDSDVLSEEQMRWLILRMDNFKSIVFETDSVGLIERRSGLGALVPFRIVMRGR